MALYALKWKSVASVFILRLLFVVLLDDSVELILSLFSKLLSFCSIAFGCYFFCVFLFYVNNN